MGNRLAGELDLPVFMYGELASAEERRERAFFRDGGFAAASARMAAGELQPDFGPARLHPTAGAALVTARPPLVAFNVELDTPDIELAKAVASPVREAGGGLAGVRAIGVMLATRGVAQVSTNVHDPLRVPLRDVVRPCAGRRSSWERASPAPRSSASRHRRRSPISPPTSR